MNHQTSGTVTYLMQRSRRQEREIRRLRRALRLIDYIAVGDRDTNVGLLCDRIKGIATRALKGTR